MLLFFVTAFGILLIYIDSRIVEDFRQVRRPDQTAEARDPSSETQHGSRTLAAAVHEAEPVPRPHLRPVAAKVQNPTDKRR